MSAPNVRPIKRRVAKRPQRRTVHVLVDEGDFAGWEATAYADFKASLLADLQSMQLERIMAVLDVIVTEHNFPNGDDELAERMADVDPYAGLLEVAERIFDALSRLPNR